MAEQSESKRHCLGFTTHSSFASEASTSLPLAAGADSIPHGKFSLFILLA